MISVKRIGPGHDLHRLVTDLNQASWDEANDIPSYDARALGDYLEREDSVFVACYRIEGTVEVLLGIASGRLEIKPYEHERWLYVDEVDVCADRRRQGVASAIMEELFDIARAAGCVEVWLGTEPDNDAANALYRSLAPTERETFVGYAWKLSQA